MPNIRKETGIADKPWERIRVAMTVINAQRHTIRNAERRISEATMEIYHVLWPRTDNTNVFYTGAERPSVQRRKASDADSPNGNTVLDG